MIFTSPVEAQQYREGAQYLITDLKNTTALKSALKYNVPLVGTSPDGGKIVVPIKNMRENKLVGVKLLSNIFSEPLPEETASYFPIGNLDIAISTINKIYDLGREVEQVGFTNNTKYSQFFGWFRVSDEENNPAYRPAIAFRNSYDKSSRFAMAIGLNVNRCSNLSFSTHTVMTKHTSNQGADFEHYISEVIGKVDTTYKNEQKKLEILKNYEIDKKDVYELIGMFLYEQEVINATQCNALVRETKEQKLWGLETHYDFYMHLTEVLKTTTPKEAFDSYNKAYSVISDYIGLPNDSN